MLLEPLKLWVSCLLSHALISSFISSLGESMAPALSQHVCLMSHFSRVQLFVTPWTVPRQAPLSMVFSRQEYWSWLPCPSPGDLPDPRVEPASHSSPASAGRFFTTSAIWRPQVAGPGQAAKAGSVTGCYFNPWKDVMRVLLGAVGWAGGAYGSEEPSRPSHCPRKVPLD